jgi:hypothetical protein
MTLDEMREIALDVGITDEIHCPKCGHGTKKDLKKCGRLFIPKRASVDWGFSSAPVWKLLPPASSVVQWSTPLKNDVWATMAGAFIPMGKHYVSAMDFDTIKPELPELPVLPTRKATKPFIGYRSWYLEDHGTLLLASVVRQNKWPGPVFRADGKPSPWDPWVNYKDQPEKKVFGIYAFDSPAPAVECEGDVFGEVALSGTVVVHEEGFRAEVATIQRLVLHPSIRYEHENAKELLAERYQCPVSYNVEDLDNGDREA